MNALKKAFFTLCAAAAALADDSSQWLSFKVEYGKQYGKAEEAVRFKAFQATLRTIETLNAARVGEHDAVFAVNKFSDLTPAEFKAAYLTFRRPATKFKFAEISVARFHTAASRNATAVDWRTKQKGVVSAIKDQGQCGSCWAYSAAEQIESNYVVAGNRPIVLSAQQIISCDKADLGCKGGNTETAYQYVQKAGGIASEELYPETSAKSGEAGRCEPVSKAAVKIKGYTYATPDCYDIDCDHQDEGGMASNIAAHAPASVCVNAEKWQSYKSGTLTGTQCGGHSTDDTDHCVQVVGFSKGSSTANTNMYWIVRNSWGTEWGIGGYIHVEYGTNACGIANDATFVTL